ncbi:MAG: DUF4398 domain-containing protein [Bacteriovoracaceae bacterium]
MLIKKFIVTLFSILFLSSFYACGLTTTRPKLEMSYADAAFKAAKDAEANIHASSVYQRAEYYFIKARSSYRRKYFNKAKQYAILSQKFSEKAELIAIKKKSMQNWETK